MTTKMAVITNAVIETKFNTEVFFDGIKTIFGSLNKLKICTSIPTGVEVTILDVKS